MLSPMISMAMKPQMSDATPGPAEVDRPDLRVADAPEPVAEAAAAPDAPQGPRAERHAGVGRRADLHLGEDVLVFGHGRTLLA